MLSKSRENMFKPKICVCGVDFSNFRRRKRRNFSRKNWQIARVRRCARRFDRICAISCRVLLLRMRAHLSATDFFDLRHRFFKFKASKTLQFSAENSPIGRVRRCACQQIAFGNCSFFRFVVRCLPNHVKIFSNRKFACAASIFQIFGAENAEIFREKIGKSRAFGVARVGSIAFAQSPAVCCFLECARTCLQPIFLIYGIDFSNLRRRKRCNFPRKIRRSGAFGVAHANKSHLKIALVFASSCVHLE